MSKNASSSYESLPAFKELQKRVSLNGGRVIAFVGAGLSRSAKLPSWPELKSLILSDYRLEATTLDLPKKTEILRQCDSAQNIDDLWIAFSLIKRIRPLPVFEAAVRRHLDSSSAEPPLNYSSLWKIGINGVITLNLDDFAQRSYSTARPGNPLNLFSGINIKNYIDVLTRGTPFLCNLHGNLGDTSSWVFTEEDRTRLRNGDGLKEFFAACFLSCSVVFVGITADDIGAGGLLAELLRETKSTRLGNHYWISDRSDIKATTYADEIGLGRILYSPDHHHRELAELLSDLRDTKLEPPPPQVVMPVGKKTRHFERPSVEALLSEHEPNELRRQLNEIASDILGKSSSDRNKEYEAFLHEYEMLISRAWFIPKNGIAPYFKYNLKRLIAGEGAFGRVYEATGPDGKNYAIKIIHNDVHEDPEMLDAFRRGVASMRIVTSQSIDGVVAIRDAWELPASIVMDFIDGLNLEQAVEDHAVDDWGKKLEIFEQLANVVLRAHRLPEVVVHRDIRPPNIILEDFYQSDHKIKVSLVDFDLSWHRDAFGKSIQQTSGIHGYFAPEQYLKISGVSSRNALVDSFGLAMTMSYVITSRHPQFGDIDKENREVTLKQAFRMVKCDQWRCIPTRMARLVLNGSKKKQQERADITSILREISSLRRLYEKDRFDDLRVVIDEIGHRSTSLHGDYEWDESEGVLKYDSPSGLLVLMKRRENTHLIVSAEWRNSGNSQYQTVKKYFSTAAPKVEARLKSSGWSCTADSRYDGIGVIGERKIDMSKLKKSDIEGFAQDIDFMIMNLSYS